MSSCDHNSCKLGSKAPYSMPPPAIGLPPVSSYFKVFGVLLVLFFVNLGLYFAPIDSFWRFFLLLAVNFVQAVLVLAFFMELIHEDKYYSFIFGASFLFVVLFLLLSLAELNGRGFFSQEGSIHFMRSVDQNGNYDPGFQQKPTDSATPEK